MESDFFEIYRICLMTTSFQLTSSPLAKEQKGDAFLFSIETDLHSGPQRCLAPQCKDSRGCGEAQITDPHKLTRQDCLLTGSCTHSGMIYRILPPHVFK